MNYAVKIHVHQKVYSIKIRIKTKTRFFACLQIRYQKVYSIKIRIKTSNT